MSAAREVGWRYIPGAPRGAKQTDNRRWTIWPVHGQAGRYVLDDAGQPVRGAAGGDALTMPWDQAMDHVQTNGGTG